MYSPMDDAGFPVKAEEFVVLSQEPSVTETIAPKIARPFIEVRTDGGRLQSREGAGHLGPTLCLAGSLEVLPCWGACGAASFSLSSSWGWGPSLLGFAATSSVFKTNCPGVEKQAVQVLKFKAKSWAPTQGSLTATVWQCPVCFGALALCRVPGTETSHFLYWEAQRSSPFFQVRCCMY